jgi:regulator of protease activity HflC (stomatin/prohibitin superfamily)
MLSVEAMSERDARERDILIAPNEYAYVQDLTKGDIVLYVGPTKISLSNTERIVELRAERFVPVRADDASFGVSAFVTATSSQYIVLENPVAPGKDARPIRGSNAAVELQVGRKVVVPGPAQFPLWPGQRARVIDGHPLREDEYLVVRYYDRVDDDPHPIGAEIVVRGSDVSFYVPRTGLEVVPAEIIGGNCLYVRKATRFPRPGGLHVRVTKPLVAPADHALPEGTYAAGTDVFLADRDGYFFPDEHVEVIGLVQPIPIAEKEGIYVRARATGRIATITGPANYLVDPTREELIPRALDAERMRRYGLERHAMRAVAVYVPPSFAVLVTGKTRRDVVKGPETRILDFDEELEVLHLSTGRPKSDKTTRATCFLQVEGNKVSDVVRVQTRDHVEIEIALSYRVSFVGDDREKWFRVKDYVGLLCDHAGSILRAAARTTSIDEFQRDATELLRTAMLGERRPGADDEAKRDDRAPPHGGKRPGRLFEENGMWVYDVEVLDVNILDADVKKLLENAQRAAIVSDVKRRDEERRLAEERLKAEVDQAIGAAQTEALAQSILLDEAHANVARKRTAATIEVERLGKVGRAEADAQAANIVREAEARAKERDAEIEKRVTEARVAAFEREMAALAPELVATLRTLGHQKLAAELSKNVGPLSVLGGGSVTEIVERMLGSLPVGARSTVAEAIQTNGTNGRPKQAER